MLAAAPERTEATVWAEAAQGGGEFRGNNAAEADRKGGAAPVAHRRGERGGPGAVRGGSRNPLMQRYLSGDSQDGGLPGVALGGPVEVRRGSGGDPVLVPRTGLWPLRLKQLWCGFWPLASGFWILASPLRRLQQQGLAPALFPGVAANEMLLGGEKARLPEAGLARDLRRRGVPGVPLLLGERRVLAPPLGGGGESGARALLGGCVRVSGNHVKAPALPPVSPVIDKGAVTATQGLAFGQQPGVLLEFVGLQNPVCGARVTLSSERQETRWSILALELVVSCR